MLDVLKRRPVLNSGIVRTTEGLLREFRSAVVNQDQGAAEDWLKKIRQTGRLSGGNLRFLRIEYYAAFGMWREIATWLRMATTFTGSKTQADDDSDDRSSLVALF